MTLTRFIEKDPHHFRSHPVLFRPLHRSPCGRDVRVFQGIQISVGAVLLSISNMVRIDSRARSVECNMLNSSTPPSKGVKRDSYSTAVHSLS